MADILNAKLLQALQIDGRAPFSRIAEVLGVSDQTVARRYSRLRSSGVLRIRGLTDPDRLSQARWIVRISCVPNAATSVLSALARRSDTSWISVTSGGTEIICTMRVPDEGSDEDKSLLLDTLPRSRRVVSTTAHCVLRTFYGGVLSPLHKSNALDTVQVDRLRAADTEHHSERGRPVGSDDRPLLRALERDGRVTFAELAAVTGWSQSAVRRRVSELRAAGALYFDAEFDQLLLDLPLRAMLWLWVDLDRLSTAGEILASHRETAYVASMTGSANLYASVLCSSTRALYEYLTTRVGALPGLRQTELLPVMRTVKRAGIPAQGSAMLT